jgi:hypothetical protein
VDVRLKFSDFEVVVSLVSMDQVNDPFDDGKGSLWGPLVVV